MKKFLSMALAVIMACNFTLLGSGNIAVADYEDEEYYNFSINPYEDDYNYDFNEDLSKEEKGNKPSKIWTAIKGISFVVCTTVLGYIVFSLAKNPALSNNPEVKKIIEKSNDLLSKIKGKVSVLSNNPEVKEIIEKSNNILSKIKGTASGYYNNITAPIKKTYENVCPAYSTNGAWDCLLKVLKIKNSSMCIEGFHDDGDQCVPVCMEGFHNDGDQCVLN